MKVISNYTSKLFCVGIMLTAVMLFSNCTSNKEVIATFKTAAEILNKQTPMQISEFTRLDNVEANGKTLTTNYTVTQKIEGLDFSELEKNTKVLLGNTPAIKMMKGKGATCIYIYKDMDGKELANYKISLDDI